jgi:hypothetical protein
MRRRRDLPDAKIVVFPDNSRGDNSPAAHRATWGPDHDIPPLGVGEVVLVDRGGLIATFAVYFRMGRGVGIWVRGFRLVRWGPGQERVKLPQRSRTVTKIVVSDDGKESLIGSPKRYYDELTWFQSNLAAKAFEEAALAAVRPAVDRLRSEQPSRRSAASVDDGDDVPF